MSSEFLSRSGSVLRLLNGHHLATKVEKLITKKSMSVMEYSIYRGRYLPPAPPQASAGEVSSHCFPYAQAGSDKIVSGENIREYTILYPDGTAAKSTIRRHAF